MWQRIRALTRITAVRLSIAYTLFFSLLAVILVFYMTGGAVEFLRREIQYTINEETAALDRIYSQRGLNALIQAMEARARSPGANLYVVVDPAGRIIAGNVREIDRDVFSTTGWVLHPFSYRGFREDDDAEERRAIARVFELPTGIRFLIGRDIGERERFRGLVRRALTFSMFMMLIGAFLIWAFVGRRALRRIDMVSRSTERILAGDRSERLPVMGSNDEFDRLSARMNEMLDRISTLDEGLRAVSDSIAHDLKTPLTRMRNKLDAALNSAGDAEALRTVLGETITELDQLIRTFNALLMISRVEAGSQVAELGEIDMSAIVADVAELYEPVAEEEGFTMAVSIEPGIMVRGNRELLSQALTNLVDNALKYARPVEAGAGKLSVSLRRQGRLVHATITDNGPGIPESDRERVRERFVRLDESRSKPGTGLGLALVDAVARLHGGTLKFADAGPGLVAELAIPVAPKGS